MDGLSLGHDDRVREMESKSPLETDGMGWMPDYTKASVRSLFIQDRWNGMMQV